MVVSTWFPRNAVARLSDHDDDDDGNDGDDGDDDDDDDDDGKSNLNGKDWTEKFKEKR